MNPCEMNLLITAITNHLYTTLSKKDFIFWNVFVSELGKSMFSMEILRGICHLEEEKKEKVEKKEHSENKKDKEKQEKVTK